LKTFKYPSFLSIKVAILSFMKFKAGDGK
jgi:hypothetical protein